MKDLYSSIHEIIEGIETPADRSHAKDAIDAIIGKRMEFIAETHAQQQETIYCPRCGARVTRDKDAAKHTGRNRL